MVKARLKDTANNNVIDSHLEHHDNVTRLHQKLDQSRNLGRELAKSVQGLSPEKSLLLEEHLSVLALEWLTRQGSIEMENWSVRDFSTLTKLLLDMVDRRQSAPTATVSEAGLSAAQVSAIEQALMGQS